jgi:hypothetical protein
MILKGSPCESNFKEKRSDEEKNIPWSQTLKNEEGERKERDGQDPEKNPRNTLERGKEEGRSPPPPYESSQESNRVQGSVRIPGDSIEEKREGYDERREYHARAPASTRINPRTLRTSVIRRSSIRKKSQMM